MENREADYKKLYEETLLTLSEKEELLVCKEQELTKKEEIISDLKFQLDKFRKHLFGSKSEKRDNQAGENQLGLFELGVTKAVQEELSDSGTAKLAREVIQRLLKCSYRLSL